MGGGAKVGPGKASRIDPADAAQLAESPVPPRRVLGLFRPHKGKLVLLTATVVLTSLVGLAQPFLLRSVIDVALPTGDQRLLVFDVVGMIAVAAVFAGLGVVQTLLSTRMGNEVMHRLRVDVFDRVQRQSLAFFKRTRAGEIQGRLLQDIAGIQGVMSSVATSIASNLTTAIATAAAMVALNWRLSLISLVIIPPAAYATRRVALIRRDIKSRRQRMLSEMHSQVDEALSVNGAVLTKTLGAAAQRLQAFAEASSSLSQLDLASQLAGRWRMATMSVLFAAIPAFIYLAAGFPQTSGGITIGTLVAFTTLQAAIFRPIMGLLNVGADWISSLALLSRIFGYLDLPIDVAPPEHPVPLDAATVTGAVAFENVSYRYPDGGDNVLTDFTLVIPPGGAAALVGETGSGKSTAGALLVRLADPTAGRITIDGVDLRDIAPADLARVVGFVSQESYLMHASIRENLRLAKPDAQDDELWVALAAAQIEPLIRALPDGLDTVVGARGHRFSGGERQRIAIARTLLSNPRVLVLDEATSALDNETERELQAALDRLMVGRTSLTIAHRLSTIRDSDEIVVLDSGHVAERGTHDHLVALGGTYARLANEASGAHEDDDDAPLVGRRFLDADVDYDQDDAPTAELVALPFAPGPHTMGDGGLAQQLMDDDDMAHDPDATIILSRVPGRTRGKKEQQLTRR